MGGPQEIVSTYFFVEILLLENQLRLYQMKKGESIDTFLGGMNEIGDQLIAIEATSD